MNKVKNLFISISIFTLFFSTTTYALQDNLETKYGYQSEYSEEVETSDIYITYGYEEHEREEHEEGSYFDKKSNSIVTYELDNSTFEIINPWTEPTAYTICFSEELNENIVIYSRNEYEYIIYYENDSEQSAIYNALESQYPDFTQELIKMIKENTELSKIQKDDSN